MSSEPNTPPFWTRSLEQTCAALQASVSGLTAEAAATRLSQGGANVDVQPKRTATVVAAARRLLEPLVLILLAAAVVSALSGDGVSAAIIVTIILISVGLDTVQEARASKAAAALQQAVALTAEALRDGQFSTVPAETIVPGDVIRIRTGDIVPADGLVLESSGFAANEAALTGEAYPAAKTPGAVASTSPAEASNAVFRGSVAQTGEAIVLAVATGRASQFGAIALLIAQAEGPSLFQTELRGLGLTIARAAGVLSLGVLVVNLAFGRPLLQSVMFAVALAVGLTPELLPMITTVTLSRGAVRMARRKVIVKRLSAIHDLGAMTVLCTDKTGTLTSAEITLAGSVNALGKPDDRPADLAALCASLAGDRGAMDVALAGSRPDAAAGWTALARLAFSYERRRGSVLSQHQDETLVVCKGAPEAVLAVCDFHRTPNGIQALDAAAREGIAGLIRAAAAEGLRAVAVATKACAGQTTLEVADEAHLVFEGFCTFQDPPKLSSSAALKRLAAAGVRVKILSGDDPIIVARVAGLVGLGAHRVISGPELEHMSDASLRVRVRHTQLFGRLTPDQKVRVVRALQEGGEAVGFLGDGVNDAPGIRAADIGLSVDGATGVARAAADMVLLETNLDVVADGVEEGRRTFENILKYVRMGASSNFGNMLSMAAASLVLPFLPLLATQILLNNLLYDLSQVGLPFDSVEAEVLQRPQRWSMGEIQRYALVMGALSSVFDLSTFAVLILLLHAAPAEFRTAWFVESITTQILVVFIIRTRGVWWRSKADPRLVVTALLALSVALFIPLTALGAWFAFTRPTAPVLLAITAITVTYLVSAQALKSFALAPMRPPVRRIGPMRRMDRGPWRG